MQTDGWLSERSAKVYEVSTETLFLGRQDAMQRQTLVPLHAFMAGRMPNGRGTRLLEVAAGTGRFATFIKVRNRLAELSLQPEVLTLWPDIVSLILLRTNFHCPQGTAVSGV